MQNRRVVVTGMHAISSLGQSWETFRLALESSKSGIRVMEDWKDIAELTTHLAGPVDDFTVPAHWTRKQMRSMGRVSKLAVAASEQAIRNSGLDQAQLIGSGQLGIAYGSCIGSTDAIREFTNMITASGEESKVNATTYIRLMGHTAPVNIAVFFGVKGRIINTSTACTSGSQGVGYGYEMIQSGKQTAMVAGGAEELCPSQAAIFDTLFATSTKNDAPSTTPRPFDRDRDGLVVGEGACSLLLEEMDHACARNAPIHAELVGYGTNCDGDHITQPNSESMETVMQLALEDAGLKPSDIGYINAHGTGTFQGDVAESNATLRLFGSNTPISTLKGHLGHTLGACGALESWASIQMMNDCWFAPTLNLENPGEDCAKLDYIVQEPRHFETDFVMCNNFAFGGINTSLIFKKWYQ